MKSVLKNEPIVVLDACALIAFLNDQTGAEIVANLLRDNRRSLHFHNNRLF